MTSGSEKIDPARESLCLEGLWDVQKLLKVGIGASEKECEGQGTGLRAGLQGGSIPT